MPKPRKPVPPEKTAFISYRREPSILAAAYISEHLEHHGFDVFWDIEEMPPGDFEQTLLNQIAARTHFILILAPTVLERCIKVDGYDDPEDWLRREIERAMDSERNIIPVMMEGFEFKGQEKYLTGKLRNLSRYQ